MHVSGTIKNQLITFDHQKFGKIRGALYKKECVFASVDIAKALKYAYPKTVVRKYVPDKFKLYLKAKLGPNGELRIGTFLTEAGIYQLLFHSRMPYAEEMRQWLAEEVLPTLRKTGEYKLTKRGKNILAPTVDLIRTTEERDRMRNELVYCNSKIAELITLAGVGELFSKSDDCCSVGAFAKLLREAGYPFGRARLYSWLQRNGYIMKPAYDRNCPTQWAVERDYIRTRTQPINSSGRPRFTRRPVITPGGANHIYAKIKKEYGDPIPDETYDEDGYIILEEVPGSKAYDKRIEYAYRKGLNEGS